MSTTPADNTVNDTTKRKVVVIYSGGMDSFTALHQVLREADDDTQVFCVTFDYGQRHKKEVDYAARVCTALKVSHKIIDISVIHELIGGGSCSLMTDAKDDIPEGHYAADNMKSTVVPNRNMILLSLAVGYAVSLNASQVIYGAHSGDHASKSCSVGILGVCEYWLVLLHI